MEHIIGIDLGTTFSCIAFMEGDTPKVIPNLEGFATTPSVVSFTSSGKMIIGNTALRQAVTNPQNTLYAIKRIMGMKFNAKEIEQFKKRVPYGLTEAENGDVMIEVQSRTISPQELSSIILKYLKKCAESFLGEDISKAVITVPAHFNEHQRQATKDAAKIAGLDIIRVINEPTAACLAHGLNSRKNTKAAVYDMGGGTFDISIVEIEDGVFNVLATSGNTFLGGEDFDNRIADWIKDDFQKETDIDLSSDGLALQRIKEAAENAKRELSFSVESEINLPFILSHKTGSKHIKKILSRKKLEDMTKDLIQETFPFMDKALADCGLESKDIEEVILVGGQTRMPLLKKMITDYFQKQPIEDINPEEIVARGAAIQSEILQKNLSDLVLLLDVTPFSLGIETENRKYTKVIEKNTTIPTKKTMSFTTVEDNQRRVKIHVLQGENENAEENVSLAVFNLVGIGLAPAGVPEIDVTFEINADGLVQVSAKDMETGREQKIEVQPSSGLSAEELNKIIKRSIEEQKKSDAEGIDHGKT
ncbi:MAG: molecular chaperone DnaK [Candidatus Aminicenantes bacterium]|nr:molecular chaperone DnaK [Candidatus Aminicenantes bacterium]